MPCPAIRSRHARLLLTAMSASPGRSWYGYELCKLLGFKSGTLYPLLIRLRDHGLLEARWEEAPTPGRPPRHLYTLSGEGVEAARAIRDGEPGTRPLLSGAAG